MLRLLWHGTTRAKDPTVAALGNIGFDLTQNNLMGLAVGGPGIRFTTSADLASQHAYVAPQSNMNQIMLCFVIVGETTIQPD
jgi:hypothetical protein